MKNYEEQNCKRIVIRRDGKNYYLIVSYTDIMFSGPAEGGIQEQEMYSMANLVCRLVSLARRRGENWDKILKQFDGANVTGNRTLVRDMAGAIRRVV